MHEIVKFQWRIQMYVCEAHVIPYCRICPCISNMLGAVYGCVDVWRRHCVRAYMCYNVYQPIHVHKRDSYTIYFTVRRTLEAVTYFEMMLLTHW